MFQLLHVRLISGWKEFSGLASLTFLQDWKVAAAWLQLQAPL